MKTQNFLYAVLIFLIFCQGNAQNKTEKSITSIETVLNSKNFEFIANTMIPQSGGTKNLVGSNYSISFTPEMIVSNLPFYGRAYSAMALSDDKGMRFKGNPQNFNIAKTDKGYEINATVKGENDTYFISITASNSGFATLSISSNDRGTISYQGEIVKTAD